MTPDGRFVVCVREWHGAPGAGEARNQLVVIPADGSAEPVVLVGDGGGAPDFVSNPRVSADGSRLCWLQWNHPDMPWDSTELWVGTLRPTPEGLSLEGAEQIAGGAGVSIAQPEWAPDGSLSSVGRRRRSLAHPGAAPRRSRRR